MLNEIECAEGPRYKAHFAAGEEIFVESDTAAPDIEASLPLVRMFFYIEENVIRKQCLQHLNREELIHIGTCHRRCGALRLHVERKVDIALGEIRCDRMRIVEAEERAAAAIPHALREMALPVRELQTARNKKKKIFEGRRVLEWRNTGRKKEGGLLCRGKRLFAAHVPWGRVHLLLCLRDNVVFECLWERYGALLFLFEARIHSCESGCGIFEVLKEEENIGNESHVREKQRRNPPLLAERIGNVIKAEVGNFVRDKEINAFLLEYVIPVPKALEVFALALLVRHIALHLRAREEIEADALAITHGFDDILAQRANALPIHGIEPVALVPDVFLRRKTGQAILVARNADAEIDGNITQGMLQPILIADAGGEDDIHRGITERIFACRAWPNCSALCSSESVVAIRYTRSV